MADGGASQAGEALAAITEQVIENVKATTPHLEDLLKSAIKYQEAMELVNQAGDAFISQLNKAAVTACKARGATSELGSGLQKVVTKHMEVSAAKKKQSQKFNEQFVTTLTKRLSSDKKTFPSMEDDFKTITKTFKSDMKKAGEKTVKARKQVLKKGASEQDALDAANKTLMDKSKSYEEFNQRFLKTLMIEQRRRYCYLVDNYLSVFDVDLPKTAGAELIKLAGQPEKLTAMDEGLIMKHSSASPEPDKQEPPAPSFRPPPGGVAIDLLRAQQMTATSFKGNRPT